MEARENYPTNQKMKSLEIPTDHDLMNYVKAYMGSYRGIIEKEHPDSVPPLAKNAPYDIEACLLPNNCFCMLFQKSNKENIIISERSWDFVEGKVVSGMDYLITVYAHEGATVADAIKKGKKDAINDIRAMESNDIVQASLHLERIVDELTDVAMSNRSSLRSIASQVSKLSPIKESVKRGVSQSDMMRAIQSVKDYPVAPVEVKLDIPDRELLETLSTQLSGASNLIGQIEAQERVIEDLEEKISEGYDSLASKIDEKIDRGLALVLTASDRKIDEGLAGIAEVAAEKGLDEEKLHSLEEQLDDIKNAVSSMKGKSQSFMSEKLENALTEDLSEIRKQLGEFRMRIEVIEEYLMKISGVIKRRT